MTVQDLLRHTAGLVYAPPIGNGPIPEAYRDANVGNRDEHLAEMVTKMSKLPLAHQPGKVWEYSMATDVLGRIIEVVSGMELDRFIEERVTEPLGMTVDRLLRHARPNVTGSPSRRTIRRPESGRRCSTPRKSRSGCRAAAAWCRPHPTTCTLCKMLLHGGRLGNTRLLSQSTVKSDDVQCAEAGDRIRRRSSRALEISGRRRPWDKASASASRCARPPGQNPLPGSVGNILLDRRLWHDVFCRSQNRSWLSS